MENHGTQILSHGRSPREIIAFDGEPRDADPISRGESVVPLNRFNVLTLQRLNLGEAIRVNVLTNGAAGTRATWMGKPEAERAGANESRLSEFVVVLRETPLRTISNPTI